MTQKVTAFATPITRLRVEGRSVADTYWQRVQLLPQDRAFFHKKDGTYTEVTWAEVHDQVLGIFSSLKKAGIAAGDRAALYSNTRPEWVLCDWAILALGAVTVPVYQSSTPDDIAFILENSSAKLVFVEDQLLVENLKRAFQITQKPLPMVQFQNVTTASSEDSELQDFKSFTRYEKSQTLEKDFETSCTQIAPTQIASIVYTSGTTGRPKGAVLTHSNFVAALTAVAREIDIRPDDITITFLPFAHILGRVESMAPLFCGLTLGFAESINTIASDMAEIKPTFMIGVPRIFEKVYAKIQTQVEASPPVKKNMFRWAEQIGREVARRRSNRENIPPSLLLKYGVADRVVFSKVRAKLGGKLRISACGGAPFSPEMCEFFHACGIKVLEGYGLTETLGPIFVNRPDDFRFGTVGKPLTGGEVKIAEDGEILLRGPMVFKEYFKNPEATKEAFSQDGWFCTGDIGSIDNRGFLKITDRKKELIVTSGGKNIAPQKLENLLKGSRYISNCMVYGDKKKYIVALLTLDRDAISEWAKTSALDTSNWTKVLASEQLEKLLEREINEVNRKLPSFETIKRFAVLPEDFSIETGECTPSLKLKRRVISQRHQNLIESLYS